MKQKTIWVCCECGHKQPKWSGSCTTCNNWNTFTEEVQLEEKKTRYLAKKIEQAKPTLIQDVNITSFERIKTHLNEFDRLMGGGIVQGSLSLMGGEPGIGKSTIMLQISAYLANQGLVVLYVSGEESAEQTSLRAKRLGIHSSNLYLLAETRFSYIQAHIQELKPDVIVVDSVQILYKEELPSAPGSVAQVREITMEFLQIAKGMGITTFLIGHVTKSGEIAGPRILEHIVDTVFEFEGDRQFGYRLIRSVKNRFGPTDDVAIFQMAEKGLQEVENPSEIFLQERLKNTPGSVIIPTMEGTRALLVEVQALVAPSSYATSTRRSTGLDARRLPLLLAVLEKRMGYHLHDLDLFVSIAGGLKIGEPAIDLGILLAISSSFCSRSIHSDTVVFGEVGLGGEIRSVPRVDARIKEAIHMGFTRCVLPKRNLQNVAEHLTKHIELIGFRSVEETIAYLLG